MSRLNPAKLHVRHDAGPAAPGVGPGSPRRYTLTHSDVTGDLYLTVAADYDRKQISGWYTRLMRDEVLAEWRDDEMGAALHVFCHVSGGLAFGSAALRDSIFRHELPLALEAICQGDKLLYTARPELAVAPIYVHFDSTKRRYRRFEQWGTPANYQDVREEKSR